MGAAVIRVSVVKHWERDDYGNSPKNLHTFCRKITVIFDSVEEI